MRNIRRITLLVCGAVLAVPLIVSCGGKEYLPPPEERPGELEQINPAVRDTDERVPYSVDVPVP
jgi:hypothetical protein